MNVSEVLILCFISGDFNTIQNALNFPYNSIQLYAFDLSLK